MTNNSTHEHFPVSVSLSTNADGATIRYTIDGTTPDELSDIYRKPIVVESSDVQVRVLAHKSKTK